MSSAANISNAYDRENVVEACIITLAHIRKLRRESMQEIKRKIFNQVLSEKKWFGLKKPLTGMAAAREAIRRYSNTDNWSWESQKSYAQVRYSGWEEETIRILKAAMRSDRSTFNLSIETASSLRWRD